MIFSKIFKRSRDTSSSQRKHVVSLRLVYNHNYYFMIVREFFLVFGTGIHYHTAFVHFLFGVCFSFFILDAFKTLPHQPDKDSTLYLYCTILVVLYNTITVKEENKHIHHKTRNNNIIISSLLHPPSSHHHHTTCALYHTSSSILQGGC